MTPSSATGAGQPTTLDDAVLAARFARGDPAAFPALVARHQEQVTRLAYRLLGWNADIEDVVQDVFVAVLQSLAKFRGESRFATWLYRIAVNQCRRHQRRWLPRWHTAPPAASDHRSPDTRLAADETHARVRRVVAALPARDREVIVLRYLEGLEIDEMSAILGRGPNTVEVRLARARARLRADLKDLVDD